MAQFEASLYCYFKNALFILFKENWEPGIYKYEIYIVSQTV